LIFGIQKMSVQAFEEDASWKEQNHITKEYRLISTPGQLKQNRLIYESSTNRQHYWNGVLHRVDGPAFEDLTRQQDHEWYLFGMLHRKHGPAIEYNSTKEYEYWRLGVLISSNIASAYGIKEINGDQGFCVVQ